jgi:hypothetical protein
VETELLAAGEQLKLLMEGRPPAPPSPPAASPPPAPTMPSAPVSGMVPASAGEGS